MIFNYLIIHFLISGEIWTLSNKLCREEAGVSTKQKEITSANSILDREVYESQQQI
jgi:hypothetical protein